MIHHYSISVGNTKYVADVLANLLNGTITKFNPHNDSYIIWLGNEYGTAIELFPNGTEMIPDAKNGQANFVINAQHSGFSATHAAISTKRSKEEILDVAKGLAWRALELPRGGFSVIEFWIENKVMIELLTPNMTKDYLLATKKFMTEYTNK
ncbi:MAG: hypothetical protein KAG10_07870 [Methylococcales bacterium]|nr:hypothetical protein [Methylococcales bacterium]MCK5925794.1 hypothetical protein [Methylococcales bacterium]